MSKRFASPEIDPPALSVVVFCGGRGATSILRALLRTNVRVTALVNAYDDGLSTGRLRGFVPGMLGASDFRKNLSQLLEISSPAQLAVADLLEYRFPIGFDTLAPIVAAFEAAAEGRFVDADALPEALAPLVAALDRDTARILHTQLAAFAAYADSHAETFSIDDCALGNLLLAGAYQSCGRSFNAAVATLARALRCRADVLNVTEGENRILVALKADGEILERESRIVGPQSPVPIVGLYLLPEMLVPSALAGKSGDERASMLQAMHRDVSISTEARAAIASADVIVYGPGTQHSSLLPSYLTRGVPEAIANSRARHRVFVVNLRDDHDTQGLRPVDLVDRALGYLGDPGNRTRLVTDVLLPDARVARSGFDGATYLGARIVSGALEATPGVHNGTRVVDELTSLLHEESRDDDARIDVYVDLHRRSLTAAALVQELVEMPWRDRFAHATLLLNHVHLEGAPSPAHLSIEQTAYEGLFSEITMLLRWLREGRSRFLASLTGDGEYRLRDVDMAVDLLRARRFGVILGARNQSKQQFFGSLRHAYAGKRWMYAASVAGGFGVSAICGARLGLILSDPLTGFRVYDRRALSDALVRDLLSRPPRTTLEVTARLVDHGVELAEVPVSYHSHLGFTDERWRLMRGLVNAVSVLR